MFLLNMYCIEYQNTRLALSMYTISGGGGGGGQVENQIVDSRGALVGHEEGENGRGNHELITTASSESATTVHTNG